MLGRLMTDYNKRFHTTIGMSPNEASLKENFDEALQNTLNKTKSYKKNKPKFKFGDKVRISRTKGIFEKGYLPNWSEAIYIIHEVKNSILVTYILKDTADEIMEGGFYENELQKTDQELYRIERVLRKKQINGVEHAFVKWAGYSEKFNEWIPVKNLTNM